MSDDKTTRPENQPKESTSENSPLDYIAEGIAQEFKYRKTRASAGNRLGRGRNHNSGKGKNESKAPLLTSTLEDESTAAQSEDEMIAAIESLKPCPYTKSIYAERDRAESLIHALARDPDQRYQAERLTTYLALEHAYQETPTFTFFPGGPPPKEESKNLTTRELLDLGRGADLSSSAARQIANLYNSTSPARNASVFAQTQALAALYLLNLSEHLQSLHGETVDNWRIPIIHSIRRLRASILYLPRGFRGSIFYAKALRDYLRTPELSLMRMQVQESNSPHMNLRAYDTSNLDSFETVIYLDAISEDSIEALGLAHEHETRNPLTPRSLLESWLILNLMLFVDTGTIPLVCLDVDNYRMTPGYLGRGIVHHLSREFPYGRRHWHYINMPPEEKAEIQARRRRDSMRKLREERTREREELKAKAESSSAIFESLDAVIADFAKHGIFLKSTAARAYAIGVMNQQISYAEIRAMRDALITRGHWDAEVESILTELADIQRTTAERQAQVDSTPTDEKAETPDNPASAGADENRSSSLSPDRASHLRKAMKNLMLKQVAGDEKPDEESN